LEYTNGVSVNWGVGTSFDQIFTEPYKVEFNLSSLTSNDATVSDLHDLYPFRTNEVAFHFNERGFR
jgi:hypothetical protein